MKPQRWHHKALNDLERLLGPESYLLGWFGSEAIVERVRRLPYQMRHVDEMRWFLRQFEHGPVEEPHATN